MNKKTMSMATDVALAALWVAALAVLAIPPLCVQAQRTATAGAHDQAALLDELAKLKAQVERLQATVEKCQTVGCPATAEAGTGGTAQMATPGMEDPEPGAMQGGKRMEHSTEGMGAGMPGGGMQRGMEPPMAGGMEHPMGGMGGGSPTPLAHPTADGGMGGERKPGMGQHMQRMHEHMDQMHGGGIGTPAPTSPIPPPTSGAPGQMHDM